MESYPVPLPHIAAFWLNVLAPVLGLIVGGFLNVVVVRLPIMMQREWQDACAELNDHAPQARPRYNLAWPRSHCPHCRHALRWHELLPIVGWLRLRGRCAHCGAAISPQYLLIEILTAALFLACALRFGLSPTTAAAMAACAALLALAAIDARTMLLPDAITQPLLWAGLLLSLGPAGFADPASAVLGAAAGYIALALVGTIFKLVTGKDGMGQGDWKLLAALGAWLGWQALPIIVLLASVGGVLVGTIQLLRGRAQRDQPMPFGPYLAAAGIAALLLPGAT